MNTTRTRRFRLSLLALAIALAGLAPSRAQQPGGGLDWPAITNQTKPWTRWWWLGSIVNERDLTREMEAYQQAGLGGLEITPIYGVKGYEDRAIPYLSPKWVAMLDHTLTEGGRLGLGLDMATGTGWPFGGPWIGEAESARYFAQKSWVVRGGERLAEPVAMLQKPLIRGVSRRYKPGDLKDPITANPNLQALAIDQVRYEKPLPLQVLMAYGKPAANAPRPAPLGRSLKDDAGPASILDLTEKVGSDGRLDWVAPPGEWTLIAIFQGWHGKQVERAAPGGEGNVIDHFSPDALRHYLGRFDQALAGHDLRGLRAFFSDSYEVDDSDGQATWTPRFLAEFQRRRGYDLRRHLPALLGKDTAEANARVLCDYRETISDLLLDGFTRPWRAWAAAQGKIVRNQSHGSPANILDLYAASDIPETEGQEILRMKFATSAAHVAGKPLASAETATWLNEHTMATLGDVKQAVDRLFLGGVNHICYHGTPFTPADAEWPGFLFYAAVHFGTTNPFYRDFATLNRYVARSQSFLQRGRPDSDLLFYYPVHDDWMTAPPEKRGPLQHYGGGIESGLGQKEGQMLLDAGYSYDLVSDRQLNELSVAGSALRAGGASYQTLALPEVRYLPEQSLARLLALARQGATILVERALPADVPGLDRLDARRKTLAELTAQLKFAPTASPGIQRAAVGKGRVLLGNDLRTLLEFAEVRPEPMSSQGLQFVRRREEAGPVYFVVNPTARPLDGWVALRASARAVGVFDPMRETKGLASIRKGPGGATEVYLQLAPGESRILKTFATEIAGEPLAYDKPADAPRPLTGRWSVRFASGGPSLPAPLELDALRSWTDVGDEAARSFAGTAVYTLRFPRPADAADVSAWRLDLGRVADSARVSLNGRELGVLLGPVFQLRLHKDELAAENTLEIAVTNSMTNRIIDLDRRGVNWKRFYNTNFPAKRKENAGPDGLFNASRWPLRESGLLGPVQLIPLTRK